MEVRTHLGVAHLLLPDLHGEHKLHVLHPPEGLEEGLVGGHRRLQHGGQWSLDDVLQRDDVPAAVAGERRLHHHIQMVQYLRIIVLGVGAAQSCVQHGREIVGIYIGALALQFVPEDSNRWMVS